MNTRLQYYADKCPDLICMCIFKHHTVCTQSEVGMHGDEGTDACTIENAHKSQSRYEIEVLNTIYIPSENRPDSEKYPLIYIIYYSPRFFRKWKIWTRTDISKHTLYLPCACAAGVE